MRDVQKVLLALGAAALGASVFGLPVLCWAMGQPHPPGLAGAAAGALYLMFVAAGSMLGAILGLVAAVLWLRKRKNEPWERRIWCGVALGSVLGLALHGISRLTANPPGIGGRESWPLVFARVVIDWLPLGGDLFNMLAYWPVAAVLTAALGMLGGVSIRLTRSLWGRQDGGKPQPRDEPL